MTDISLQVKAIVVIVLVLTTSCHEVVFRRNQAAAKETFRKIRDAQKTLKETKGKYFDLQELCDAGFLSKDLADGKYHGYIFRVEANDTKYVATAIPEKYSKDFESSTGNFSLYLDETGIIRLALKEGKEASSDDTPMLDED